MVARLKLWFIHSFAWWLYEMTRWCHDQAEAGFEPKPRQSRLDGDISWPLAGTPAQRAPTARTASGGAVAAHRLFGAPADRSGAP
jgi:hypothetical protein